MNEYKKNPALTRALNLLSKRSYSEKKLREKIMEKDFAPELADMAIARLKELSYVDDKTFAQNLAREMAEFRQFGPRRIYMELIKKGIDKNLARETVDNIEYAFDESVDEALKKYLKKCKNVPREKIYNRALGFLIRRGFDYGVSKDAVIASLK